MLTASLNEEPPVKKKQKQNTFAHMLQMVALEIQKSER